MGMRWRIGDGKSINIYNENWLPGRGSAKVVSLHVHALEGAQVAALINPDTRTWNQNMLQQHFLSFEANRYKLLCEEENASDASSSDSLKQDIFWRCIWKLCILNKIKLFLWRACSNALPTKENLKRRKILDDAKCSACLSAQENTFHAIWSCELLHHIWNPCFNWIRTKHPLIQDVQELVDLVGQRTGNLELLAVVAWFIWNHRNQLRLNEKGLASDKIFQAAKLHLSKF
ncbi:uncharacterized protein LOC142640263 [Castanea sativa]|uniref:uncharacterized protein LOC142640263 n=1 Tax=Castanea sativa TaxID=21020 RepID=UPI003F64F59D